MSEREIWGVALIGIAVLSLAGIWYAMRTAKRQYLVIRKQEFPEETQLGIGA